MGLTLTKNRVDFLGLKLDNLDLDESVQRIEDFIQERRPRQVFTPNAALTVWSHQDPYLKDVYSRTDLLTADGIGVFMGSRILGRPVKANVPAVSMFFKFLPIAQKKGYRMYFLGAKPEVVVKAVENVRKEYPGINIVGYHHGHYPATDVPKVMEDIISCRPDIVFVAMSTPQKEKFIDTNKEKLNVPVMVGVGGTFDIAAGVTKLAPAWIRKGGLEWLYRLIQEPRRLWRRYAATHPAFVYLLIKAFFVERFSISKEESK